MRWKVLDSEEDGMFDIDIGDMILRMVTDDYQMACDICSEHNRQDPSVEYEP